MPRLSVTDAAPDGTHPGELTAAQIFKHAVRLGVQARIVKDDYLRTTYNRLAIRYAVLAAKREIEEKRPARH